MPSRAPVDLRDTRRLGPDMRGTIFDLNASEYSFTIETFPVPCYAAIDPGPSRSIHRTTILTQADLAHSLSGETAATAEPAALRLRREARA